MKLLKNTNIVLVAALAFVSVFVSACSTTAGGVGSTGTTGGARIAGSTARMAIVDNYR